MKKSLIALAVLAVSGAAFAQSNVTLYGIADVVIHKDKGVSAKMTSGGLAASRWGVKGSEDLGGGLKAIFNFEQAVDLTNGAASGFTRAANVGLSGGFGTIKLGKTWSAYDDVVAEGDSAFAWSVFSPNRIAPSHTYVYIADNGVKYSSPTFGGVSASVSTNFKNASATVERATAFSLAYAGGPVYVALAYENAKAIDGTTRKPTRLVGSYDLGAAKILAAFGSVKGEGKDYNLGVDVPLSSMLTLSTGFTQVRPDNSGSNANSFAVAAKYALSKRTEVYGGFRKDNKVAATSFDGVESRFGVGVKHSF